MGWDTTLFFWINRDWANPVLDWVMPRIASQGIMLWFAVPAALLIVWRLGFKGRVFALSVLVALAAGEGLVLNPLKQATGRPRPWQALEGVRHVKVDSIRLTEGASAERGRSFPSSHAANNVMWPLCAVLVWGLRRAWWVLLWSPCMMLSRVYTGDHYPLDVCVGAVCAVVYTLLLAWAAERLWRRFGGAVLHQPRLFDGVSFVSR